MPTLRTSGVDKKQYVQSKLKSIYSELLDCDCDYSIEFADWFAEKLLENKNHFKEIDLNKKINGLKNKTDIESQKQLRELKADRKKVLPKNYPASLQKGDVIHVSYGIGLGDELTDGHYGIILSRKGSLYLVAPLTSTPQPYGEYNILIKGLDLPNEDKNGGYVSYNHIRFVSYRRIENIQGIENGRRHVDKTVVDNILSNFFELNKKMM